MRLRTRSPFSAILCARSWGYFFFGVLIFIILTRCCCCNAAAHLKKKIIRKIYIRSFAYLCSRCARKVLNIEIVFFFWVFIYIFFFALRRAMDEYKILKFIIIYLHISQCTKSMILKYFCFIRCEYNLIRLYSDS